MTFGLPPPAATKTLITAKMKASTMYYKVYLQDMAFDGKSFGLNASDYNEGTFWGALVDSGTTLTLLPSKVYYRAAQLFDEKAAHLKLPKAKSIFDARCWPLNVSNAGMSVFPTFSIQFEGGTRVKVRPEHYMFLHPSVADATHYCNGLANNGYSGLVLGALFMRYFRVTIDRRTQLVRATAPVIQCGTRVLVPLLDSLMFGRVLK